MKLFVWLKNARGKRALIWAISRNGESIICLPNKIVLKIVDGEEAELDAVTN